MLALDPEQGGALLVRHSGCPSAVARFACEVGAASKRQVNLRTFVTSPTAPGMVGCGCCYLTTQ